MYHPRHMNFLRVTVVGAEVLRRGRTPLLVPCYLDRPNGLSRAYTRPLRLTKPALAAWLAVLQVGCVDVAVDRFFDVRCKRISNV